MALERGHFTWLARGRGKAGEAGDKDSIADRDGTRRAGTGQRRLPDEVRVVAPVERHSPGLTATERAGAAKLRPVGRRGVQRESERHTEQAGRDDLNGEGTMN